MSTDLPDIIEQRRLRSLAWTVFEETAVPGIPWAAASTGGTLYFTSGEGPDDDRYIRRYLPGAGFDDASLPRS